MATSVSSLQKKILALTNNKVDIMLNADTFKNTTEILREMSTVWKDMTDIQQANALDLLGGKRQANILAAIINNFDTVEEAIKSSQDSAGSALEENEKYMASIQGHIDQLNNSIQTLWKNTISDDLVKFVVNLAKIFVDLTNNIGLVRTSFIGLMTVFMRKNGIKNIGDFFAPKDLSADTLHTNIEKIKTEYDSLAGSESQKNLERRDALKTQITEYETEIAKQREPYLKAQEEAQQKLNQAKSDFYKLDDDADPTTIQAYTNNIQEADDALHKTQVDLDNFDKGLVKTGKTGQSAFEKLGAGAKAFAIQLKSVAKQLLTMYAITVAIELIGKTFTFVKDAIDGLYETAEEAQEKFEELNNELSATKSELRNINSELKDTQEQIDALMKQGTLSFADQEELDRLKARSVELRRQISLQETLQKQQQEETNAASIHATNKYMEETSFGSKESRTERQEKSKENWSTSLKAVGLIGGAVIAGLLAIPTGGMSLAAIPAVASAAGVGAGIGAVVGGTTGELIGGAVGKASYDSEQSVQDAVKNMKTQRAELLQAQDEAMANQDAEAYKEAAEELQNYDAMMAKHISQIQENYNAIDWETATTAEREAMQQQADILDAYNIEMGGKDAKANAISRIFGEEATDEIKAVKKAFEDAKGAISLEEAFGDNIEAYDAFVARMLGMGVYIVDVENYFGDLAQAEKDALENVHTYDTVKQIANITKGVDALKNALEELRSEGQVSSDTIIGMYDDFKDYGDAWEEWVDAVSTGTSTMGEIEDKTSNLVNEIIQKYINDGKYDPKEYQAIVSRLQKLGVQDAQNYVDQTLTKNAIEDTTQKLGIGETQTKFVRGEGMVEVSHGTTVDDVINASKEQYGDLLTDEKYRTAIEKQIALEKAKQAEEKVKADALTYKSAQDRIGVLEQEIAELEKESAEYLKQELSHYGLTSFNPDDWLFNGYSYEKTDEYGNKEFLDSAGYEHLKESIENGYAEAAANKKIELNNLEATAKVTDVDVDNATKARELAEDAVEAELGTLGLDLKIKLFDDSVLVDDIQSVFDTLKNAQKEYNENGGYMTVDTLQEILKLEPKYIALLYNEKGQLDLTTESLKRVAIAKINNMTISQAQGLIDQATLLLSQNKIEALKNLTIVTDENTESTWANVQSNLAAFKAQVEMARAAAAVADRYKFDGIYEGVASVVNGLMNSTKEIEKNFDNAFPSASDTAKSEVENAFQKAMAYWENLIEAKQHQYEQVQNEIDLLESQGKRAGVDYYVTQNQLETERLNLLERQRDEARSFLASFSEGSEEWWEAAKQLNSIEDALDDVRANVIALQDAIGELRWATFEDLHTRLGNLTTDLSNLRDALSMKELFDEMGNFTEAGTATLATYIHDLEIFENGLQDVQEQLKDFEQSYEGNESYFGTIGIHSEEEYYQKLIELTDKQDDYTKSINDTKQSTLDMYDNQIDAVEEYMNELIESYNDYIDVVKESLDAERDLYEFRKSIQKQTKDISSLERRIASLSGSQNQADIATRRKLEAELYDAKEELNDSYYDNAKDAQSQALDNEATAYEESTNKYIESLRNKTKLAKENIDELLDYTKGVLMLNADSILVAFDSTGIAMSEDIRKPWADLVADKNFVKFADGSALDFMNIWTTETGTFGSFSSTASEQLISVFEAGSTAAESFAKNVDTTINGKNGLFAKIQTNIDDKAKALDELAKRNHDTTSTDVRNDNDSGGQQQQPGGGNESDPKVEALQSYLNKYFSAGLVVDGSYGPATSKAVASMQQKIGTNNDGKYGAKTYQALSDYYDYLISAARNDPDRDMIRKEYKKRKSEMPAAYYAKGTLATKRDEIALTDEYGPELTLVPTAAGNLSFMRAGTSVVPADLTSELMKIGKIGLNGLMQMPTFDSGMNVVNTAINKPEYNFSFENLLHVDNCTEETLPQVKKIIQTELDSLMRRLNYSLKRA